MDTKADVSYVNESLMTKSTRSDLTATVATHLEKHLEDIRYQVDMNTDALTTVRSCVQLTVCGVLLESVDQFLHFVYVEFRKPE